MNDGGAVRMRRPTIASSGSTAGVVAACTVAVGVGAALGFIPGYVATALRSDLGISRAQVGLLVSVYFGSTGIGSITGGRLTDRFGARTVVTADMVLVAVCALTAAASGRYPVLVVTAIAAGFGYSWANAGTNEVIARRVHPSRRTIAMSIKTAGVPTMASLSALAAAPGAQRWSWHAVWIVVAMVAACAALITTLALSNTPTLLDDVRPPAPPRGIWWFALAAFLFVGGSQPIFSWIVPYMEESLDASARTAGQIASVAAAFGVLALVVNGYLADRSGAEHRLGRVIKFTALSVVSSLTIWSSAVLFEGQNGLIVVALGAILGTGIQLSVVGTMHAAIADRAPRSVARATGVTMTGYYLGALASPAAFGALADATGSYSLGWFILSMMLLASIPAWRMGGSVPIQND